MKVDYGVLERRLIQFVPRTEAREVVAIVRGQDEEIASLTQRLDTQGQDLRRFAVQIAEGDVEHAARIEHYVLTGQED